MPEKSSSLRWTEDELRESESPREERHPARIWDLPASPPPEEPSVRGREFIGVRYLVTTVALLVLLLVGDSIYVAVRLTSALRSVRSEASRVLGGRGQGRLPSSPQEVAKLLKASEDAASLSRHPAVVLAAGLPWIRDDVRAVRALSQAVLYAARGGISGMHLGELLSGLQDPQAQTQLFTGGRINVVSLRTARSLVASAGSFLETARGILEDAGNAHFANLRQLSEALGADIASAIDAGRRADIGLAGVISFLGENAPRNYLLAFQAPSEARATGGLFGLYGVLEVRDGQLNLLRLGSAEKLPALLDPVSAPSYFESIYAPSGLTDWRQVNQSPNFPVVAEVWLRMYEALRGPRLDGVLAMDPILFSQLLTNSPPLRVSGLELPVTASNAARILMRDSYLEFDSADQQTAYLRRLVREFWDRIERGDIEAPSVIDAITQGARSGHLKIYVRDEDERRAVELLGAAARLDPAGPNTQFVFTNSYSATKVDYFLRRSISTVADFSEGDHVEVTTLVRFENSAPSEPPSLLIGREDSGFNKMALNFLLPQGASVELTTIDGDLVPFSSYEEDGFPVFWHLLEIAPGESAEIEIKYRLPLAPGEPFRFALLPQAAASPELYRLTIVPPLGVTLEASGPIRLGGDGKAVATGVLSRRSIFNVTFLPP